MANNYKSFYLADIKRIIEETALETMMTPIIEGKKLDGGVMTLNEVSNYNSLVAMNNEGIRDFASSLMNRLTKEGEDNDS